MLSDWGKEYKIAQHFAKKLDLYPAILSFRRAEALVPPFDSLRLREIQYNILFCYYIGKKYVEVIDAFEHSSLVHADDTFVAYKDLLAMLFDAYHKTKSMEKAKWILNVMQRHFPSEGRRLVLTQSIYDKETFSLKELSSDNTAKLCLEDILATLYHKKKSETEAGALYLISHAYENFEEDYNLSEKFSPVLAEQVKYLSQYAAAQEGINSLLSNYDALKKSPRTAAMLNAALPGAGYFYLGQKQTAITSLLINSLFIFTTAHFIKEKNIPAAILTASFEMGWYVGGIQGATKAADFYNQRLYEQCAHKQMVAHRLYPSLMLSYGF